ncbi:D-beta-hydroxybutyrate dehydrogenase [Nostocoides japonicum T1-X7]|uniref:D-beta-hydroxybutyrate dehydrogenase n=1 Tax=Nostocoides japonicum T1-X7 TaxID=1194083 RepID=A0A077LTP9_9MICO|nr:3-hydroxybutyrate dehydrogenase [Tetrasphaera japonica]CCH77013.1 D-beta-hydroxybutyrate dehydrogenase [Tetrasphaera japonica T1-X7]
MDAIDLAPRLDGRTALVTGAASGIGLACATMLATLGATVLAVDIDEDGLRDLADRHAGIEPCVCDLTDVAAIEALPREVDILVNNAGVQHVSPIEEFPPEVFDRILRLTLHAPFHLVRACLPHMYATGWGRVVNISSVHGLRASEYKSAYVAAKHGLEGLSKVIALEGAPHGVTSNCINPSYVRTPLVEKQIADQARTHGVAQDEVVEGIMLAPAAVKRLVEPAEVAALVAFLCGPASASVTGASYLMDGGWSAH